jgi:two-component system cell cycle response regulator
MTVKAYLALLVGVFVVALLAVSLVQGNLVGDLAPVARDVTGSHAPKARAARELRAAHLAERRALAGFLLTAEPAESVRLEQARRDLRRWRSELGAKTSQPDQTELAEIDRLVAEEQAAADQAVGLRRDSRAAEARRLADEEADPPGDRVDQLLAQLSEATSGELDADAARAERTAATAGRLTVLLPLLVVLAVAGLALWLVHRVLREIARPFHAAGINIRSNADQLSAAVQQLAATTAEQSSGVAQTSATMEELARAATSIAETVDHVAGQAGTTRDNLEQARYDIRASGERTIALADRVGEVGVTRGQPAAAAGRGRPHRMAGPVSPPAVLVAEDSLVIRAVLVEQLQSHGYRVIEAGDGEQALAACHRERPDVVLLDGEMPHLDGHAVLARIKADHLLADIPVVFVTSRVTTEDVVEGLRLGAHDYLRKPFEPSELLARVHAAVRSKALQDELRLRNAELELASRTDALTGLHNRRHLEEQLQRLAGAGDHLAVLLCDINRFKRVNDTRGHAAGDEVLRVVAARLGEAARPGDVPGRWGGEEFLVVLPGTGADEAQAQGERVRRAIAAGPVPLEEPLVVTTSVGVAAGTGDGWEGLVRRADTGLYAAKEGGRDRVVAGPLAHRGTTPAVPRTPRPAREPSHRKAKMRQDTDDGKWPGETQGNGDPVGRPAGSGEGRTGDRDHRPPTGRRGDDPHPRRQRGLQRLFRRRQGHHLDRDAGGRDRVLPAEDRRGQPLVGLRRKAEQWIP